MTVMRAMAMVVALAFAGLCQAGERISPAQLQALLQADAAQWPQLLDVRTAEEYADGHIADAKLIPYDQLATRLDELDRTREVVLYCRSGRRASIAEALLQQHGFATRQLEGSWLAWQQAQSPAPQGATAPQSAGGTP